MTPTMSRYAGLEDSAALVTGAARGLGAEIVRLFVEHGASVAACDVDAAGLAAMRDGLGSDADSVTPIAADLAAPAACDLVADRTLEAFGRIDVLVNNAAVLATAPLEEVTVENFDSVIAVNLRAPFFLARRALRSMRERRWGRIVNVSSVAVRTGGAAALFPYAASKGGLLALTKAMAQASAVDGVLVNAIVPAAIDTPMLAEAFTDDAIRDVISRIPLGRLAHPREIAELVGWLCSDSASYVTGASYDVNGGWVMI